MLEEMTKQVLYMRSAKYSKRETVKSTTSIDKLLGPIVLGKRKMLVYINPISGRGLAVKIWNKVAPIISIHILLI